MIDKIVDINKLESTAQGQYRVIQTVYRGEPEEIRELQQQLSSQMSRDRSYVRYSLDTSPSFDFDHVTFNTIDMMLLCLTAVKKTDRLGI